LIGDQYLTLAIDAELVTPESDVKAAFNKVRSHLRDHNRWLLLFDNAEDPAELRSWLPSGDGHVVITSRNPGWNEVAAPVPVDVFTRKESIALVRTQLSHLSEEAAGRLAEALGDLPLGLAQAIGTIAETGMTIVEYEEALAAKASQVLAESTPPTYPIPLAAAVRLSAERLVAEDRTAGDILSLCAWLAPDPIPVSLFTGANDTPLAVHRAVGRIARFGLAIVDGDRGLQLHRLTQAILRDFTGEDIRDRVGALLVGAGPENGSDPKYWTTWAWLVPHIIALKPAESTNDDLRDVACRMLWYLINRGEFTAAQSLAEQFRTGWLSRYGSDDPALLWATNHLAEAYRNLGEHSKARPLYTEVYERNRAIHGEDHSHTLTCANNLASNMHALGELMEARRLQEETLRRRRLLLGEDSPQALTSANNLANIFRDLGDLQAAHDLHRDTLTRRRRVLGEDHLRTLRTANSLADDLRELGNFEAARDLYEDTYDRQKRVLGEDHPDTLATASSLVTTLRALGNTKDAQKLERWVVVRKRKLAVKKSEITQN
jgi:tetratricopeptide (TPR) repeat protein